MATHTKSRHFSLAAAFLAALAGGCSSDGGGGDGGAFACAEPARKDFVLATTREWYLFPELLPASVDTAAFDTAEDLLDHLTATAREQGKDRYFSYLTTKAEEDALFVAGQFIGFGVRTRTDPVDRPFITEVFEGSPAADAGVQRGDEIVAVDAGSGFVPVAELLADGSTISDVLGPAEEGVRRGLRLLRDGATREVILVKRTVTIDPVSKVYGALVLPLAGTTGVGYLNLRSYVATADAQLVDAFARFRPLGLDYFIVDLRYNGGGLIATAELLGDLLGGARATSDVQSRTVHSAAKSREDSTRNFRPTDQTVRPVRVAFLTSEATASASEINVNTLAPWIEVAIVGEDTYGKPVGQYAFDLGGCDDRLRLVTFKTENALGQSDYYQGLAGQLQFACAAVDTLEEPLGSAQDGLTSAALAWLGSGTCAAVMPTSAARSKPAAGTTLQERYPRPRAPSPAQHWMPGVG